MYTGSICGAISDHVAGIAAALTKGTAVCSYLLMSSATIAMSVASDQIADALASYSQLRLSLPGCSAICACAQHI
jgi:hypothetical protein